MARFPGRSNNSIGSTTVRLPFMSLARKWFQFSINGSATLNDCFSMTQSAHGSVLSLQCVTLNGYGRSKRRRLAMNAIRHFSDWK